MELGRIAVKVGIGAPTQMFRAVQTSLTPILRITSGCALTQGPSATTPRNIASSAVRVSESLDEFSRDLTSDHREADMEGLYFTAKIDEERTLYLAPLTDRHLAAAEPLDNIDGYFLFEQRGTGDFADIRIIAHVPTEDGALRLRQMLGMI